MFLKRERPETDYFAIKSDYFWILLRFRTLKAFVFLTDKNVRLP